MKNWGFILLVALMGCMTPKKADKKIGKIQDKFPSSLAKACAKNYPCAEKSVDTLVSYRDNYIEVPCDSIVVMADTIKQDTVFIIRTVIKKIPAKKIVEYKDKIITINKFIEDSAKIKVLTSQVDSLNKTVEQKTFWVKLLSWLLLIIAIIIYILSLIRRR